MMREPFEPDVNKSEAERLRAMLLEDTHSSDDGEQLLDVVSRMRTWESPSATPDMTAQLIENLLPEMPVRERPFSRWSRKLGQWWPLLLIRAQVRIVRREIWAASALVMVLGTLVTIGTYNPSSGSMIPIAILAPVVAAVGVALLYDAEYEQMLEIEDTTPASARILLLARLALVFGFDLLLGLVGSVFLAVFHADVLLWPLVLSWLVPMTFLSALAFLLSIMLGDALFGAALGLIAWGLHILLRTIPDPAHWIVIISLPILSSPEHRPLLLVTAAALLALAVWMVGNNERRLGESY
ncbi:MAG: hypothetical protein K8I30_11025 [Anaerolineae bacterium]|nr:hypothetical protein [Anaerolineae bacterium]